MDLEIDWLRDIKEKIYSFIQEMNEKKDFSYFKYSYSGDLYGTNVKWGLGQLVFAAKILYMIDKIKDLNPIYRANLINGINSFQTKDRYYTDRLIFKPNKRRILSDLLKGRKISYFSEQIKRAETRQSFAALLALNSKPNYPFLGIPYTKKGIERYLSKLDWTQPWAAASHFSHLLFFLHYNRILFWIHSNDADELINYAIEWISRLQSPIDGCWYSGEVPDSQKVNGAMKVLTGLSALEKLSFSYPKRIIDTSLKIGEATDACNDFNVVYVLCCCSQATDYRKDDIQKFCLKRLKQYSRYYYSKKGGFSFHLGKANDFYYGARITKGLNEPDIHGTVMFLWGITLISRILKLDLGLREPII